MLSWKSGLIVHVYKPAHTNGEQEKKKKRRGVWWEEGDRDEKVAAGIGSGEADAATSLVLKGKGMYVGAGF